MSTLIEVQNRINADFLNRDFGAETRRAIQATIRSRQHQRWGFNETATALTCSAGQAFLSLPSNLLILDDVRLTVNGEDQPMFPRDPQFIRDSNMNGSQGQPVFYALYQNRIQLSLVPDAAYSVPIYYVKALTELTADSDTNAWLEGGMQDVIAYGAAKLIWGTVIRDDKQEAKFEKLESKAETVMQGHHEQRRTPNKLKPTGF